MGTHSKRLDALIVGGGLSSLFTGVINPSYIKLILSDLDVRVISLGSLISAGLPFLTGMLLENRRVHARLYALLPTVMAVEAALTLFSVFIFAVDAAIWYLSAMILFGLFSSTVMHLLQELKQRRYRRGRAIFERRAAMADALGCMVGSALVFSDALVITDVWAVLLLGFLQTALVYLLYLQAYRRRAPKPSVRRAGGGAPAGFAAGGGPAEAAAAAARGGPLGWLPAALRRPVDLRPLAIDGVRGTRLLALRVRPEANARSTLQELEVPLPAA